MEIESVLQYLLPPEFQQYYNLLDIKKDGDNRLSFYLDEKSSKPSEHRDKELISKGFTESVEVQDFPLRDKAVYFKIRRRKWMDKQTGMIYMTNWDLIANGTNYTKEFAAFLKEILR